MFLTKPCQLARWNPARVAMFLYLVRGNLANVCLSVCLSLLQKSVKARTFKSYSLWTNLKRELEELVRHLGLSTVSAIYSVTVPAGQWLRGYLLVAKWCECAAHHKAVSSREVIAMRRILISPHFSVGYISFLFRARLPTAVHDSAQTPKCQCNNPSRKVQLHWCYVVSINETPVKC